MKRVKRLGEGGETFNKARGARRRKTLSMTFKNVPAAEKTPDRHARRDPCPDPVFAVFQNETALRFGADPFRRIKENIRRRFAISYEISGINMGSGELEKPRPLQLRLQEMRA